jgi:YggT family protein
LLPDSREMLTQLLLFVSQTLVSFFTSLLLFRFYCQLIKLNLKWVGGNIGLFVFKVTDWLVMPLKKIIPAIKNIDLSSLAGAYLVLCFYTFLNSYNLIVNLFFLSIQDHYLILECFQ